MQREDPGSQPSLKGPRVPGAPSSKLSAIVHGAHATCTQDTQESQSLSQATQSSGAGCKPLTHPRSPTWGRKATGKSPERLAPGHIDAQVRAGRGVSAGHLPEGSNWAGLWSGLGGGARLEGVAHATRGDAGRVFRLPFS